MFFMSSCLKNMSSCLKTGILLLLSLPQPVDDDSEGTVTRHVAGCAEAVHGDVEGYHQGERFLVEAKH